MEARVGGRDVTTADLAAESRAQGIALTADTRSGLLKAVVARELIAAEAQRRGLGRRPTAPSDLERAKRQTQAQWLLRALPPLPNPTPAEVKAFEASHPDAYANRRIFTLDQVTSSATALPVDADETLDEVAAASSASAHPPTRRTVEIVSDELPQVLLAALDRSTGGETVTWRRPDGLVAMRVLAVTKAPLAEAVADTQAGAALRRSSAGNQAKQLIAQLARGSVVRLRPGDSGLLIDASR